MRLLLSLIAAVVSVLGGSAAEVAAPAEAQMQADLLQMLADFAVYMKNDFQDCVEPNSLGEPCGCFRGENTMGPDERGVRPNADLAMVCAFLTRYGRGHVTLPDGVTWDDLSQMAMKGLVFAYSTHKANRLKPCAGGRYWGSTATDDAVWESSLWAMSVAYAAFFLWDSLNDTQRDCVYRLLRAECNYELGRTVPTAFDGDTKAEENGWEADVLAATLGLFPNDELAPQWFQRLREFAINSYSQRDDATDNTVIDPDYDPTTVADLYRGPNLYDDYTLQNHNYFHTSYQNVVVQELGEAALALKLFQTALYGEERWKTNALMHNNSRVMHDVLYWLALPDGELAMPNGNDWSLFLYDQVTSYSTCACFLRDPHALMLEHRAYQQIKARQQTTADGAWLLRPDVGARRMGVEAHRVMMTWLMHHVLPTADLEPTAWDDFCRQYAQPKLFTSQNIVRAANEHRFTCFSWSKGLKSYTGYIAPNSAEHSNIIVPFRANNTGNFLGWYDIEGRRTNAVPVVSGVYQLHADSYVMNGELLTNDSTLDHRFAIYSTPGNAVVYLDEVRARRPATITHERGGLMAVSVDEMTSTTRTLCHAAALPTDTTIVCQQLDGTRLTVMPRPWANIDQQLGIVCDGASAMAFGDRANNNSVMTARLYAAFSDERRTLQTGDVAGQRAVVYYCGVTADETRRLAASLQRPATPQGWGAVIAADSDGPAATRYLLLANFDGTRQCTLSGVSTPLGSPVFTEQTTIARDGATATFTADANHAVACTLRFYVDGSDVTAVQDSTDTATIRLTNLSKRRNTVHVTATDHGHTVERNVVLRRKTVTLTLRNGRLCSF